MRCLKEKCSHYNVYEGFSNYEILDNVNTWINYEGYPFCNLTKRRLLIEDDECFPYKNADEIIMRLACKIAKIQKEIDAYEELKLVFEKEKN